ncbi:MAG: PA14 domain-containing protein [Chloroflexi bacterium]|nr:PA14 domain-containing protein [Chloroflexota bacterium]
MRQSVHLQQSISFHVRSDDGARLYVDGVLLIDHWVDQPATEYSSELFPMELEAGRWYSIELEYYENWGKASVQLSWSSRSQVKEIIPRERLYSVRDPNAQIELSVLERQAGFIPGANGNLYSWPHQPGLLGEYFSGIDLVGRMLTRIDPQVDFDWGTGSPDPSVPIDNFSARWTGQVNPRFSENYTFFVSSDGGARLFVDGQLIIDQWNDHPATEFSSTIPLALTAGRSYTIELEYYENGGEASVQLSWSSASQAKQIIPTECLFVEGDARTSQVNAFPVPGESGTTDFLIGETVIGESGPLEKDDFGMPLYSDTAYFFTVSIPARALPKVAQRQLLRRIIELEKPAHTDYRLCFVDARMRVGYQASLGIDTLVAGKSKEKPA